MRLKLKLRVVVGGCERGFFGEFFVGCWFFGFCNVGLMINRRSRIKGWARHVGLMINRGSRTKD